MFTPEFAGEAAGLMDCLNRGKVMMCGKGEAATGAICDGLLRDSCLQRGRAGYERSYRIRTENGERRSTCVKYKHGDGMTK